MTDEKPWLHKSEVSLTPDNDPREDVPFVEEINEIESEMGEYELVFESEELKQSYEMGWEVCEESHVPKYKLRELAEEWEEYGKALMDQVDSKEEPAHQFAVAHLDHAEALQELLEDEP